MWGLQAGLNTAAAMLGSDTPLTMSTDELRNEAWTQFIYARGAHEIFRRRASKLKVYMRIRDFLAVALPVIIAFVATTDFIDKLGGFKAVALAGLAVATAGQVLLSLWSLIARWDESRSVSLQLMNDSNELETQWRDVGKSDVPDLESAYGVAKARQKVVDARLAAEELTEAERLIGLRAGLKELQRRCVECGRIPVTIDPPKKVSKACPVCQGEM